MDEGQPPTDPVLVELAEVLEDIDSDYADCFVLSDLFRLGQTILL